MSKGHRSWLSPTLKAGLWIDGETIAGASKPLTWSRQADFAVARTQARGHQTQGWFRGGDEPVELAQYAGSVAFFLHDEADLQVVQRALSSAGPFKVFFAFWHIDRWDLLTAESTQTLWKTSRALPWNLPGILHSNYPPQVNLINAQGVLTPQTVIKTGTPSAGEVVVPESGGGEFALIESPAVSTLVPPYVALELYYPPVFRISPGAQFDASRERPLRLELSLTELPHGAY